mgnify:CR=1 FL=1
MEAAVTAFDLKRMLIGDDPPLFLLEIVVRTLIIYAYTLVLLRWLGSRAIGQLSTVEFLLVIALGSAVGDATFYPEVPLFHAMLVITLIVGLNKLLDTLIERLDDLSGLVGVAIERSDGIIVDRLHAAGFAVFPVSPRVSTFITAREGMTFRPLPAWRTPTLILVAPSLWGGMPARARVAEAAASRAFRPSFGAPPAWAAFPL